MQLHPRRERERVNKEETWEEKEGIGKKKKERKSDKKKK
jgi:hypothetical protein